MPAHDPALAGRFSAVTAEILGRAPEHSPQPSLERVQAVCELLGDPQRAYPVIHLTGTNGKTSTARMIDRLLREHGLRTGRFTSPHLAHLGERITVDGVRLDDERVVAAWDDIEPYVRLVDERSAAEGGPPLSFFEVLTCLAFAVFADAPVDVAVVEVGLGGTWDSTNVADGTVAVLSQIALDHESWLGHSLTEIAEQKAGIIKPGAVAVLAAQQPAVADILRRRASEVGARVVSEPADFALLARDPAVGGQRLALRGLVGGADDVYLPLYGAHQAHNAVLALAAVEAFLGSEQESSTGLDAEVVRDAFAHVDSPARLEVVSRSPLVGVDAAHNPAGAAALTAGLAEAFPGARLVGVVGAMADKDVRGILAALAPALAAVVVTSTGSPRAASVDDLAASAADLLGPERVRAVPEVPAALAAALELAAGGLAGESDVVAGVVVTGSVSLAARARTLLGAAAPDTTGVDTTRRGVEAVPEDTESALFGGRLDELLPEDPEDELGDEDPERDGFGAGYAGRDEGPGGGDHA